MPCIVLEGVDGSGKSTLAREVTDVSSLPVELIHHGPPADGEHLVDVYSRELIDYSPDHSRLLLFDRLHVGETIYGPLKRGESRLSTAQFEWLELILASRGAVVHVLQPPLEEVRERLATRGETFLAPHEVETVWWAYYRERYRRSSMVRLSARALWNWASTDELRVEHLCQFPLYIGPPKPRVLFVGDTPGRGPRDVVPFTPKQGSCGTYLFDAIESIGLRRYGVTNSENQPLRALWVALSGPRTIALGNLAADRLADAEVPYRRVRHPQWWKRFRSGREREYGEEIKSAVGHDFW